MEPLFKFLAHHLALNSTQYWHLRLLSSIALGPLLGVLYLVFFGKRVQRRPPAGGPTYSLWVGSDGRLLALPSQ